MNGNKKDKNIVGYRLVAPQREGRIFLDRLTFRKEDELADNSRPAITH